MGTQRRRVTGNLIWPRLQLLLQEEGWGARERLLARIHLIAGQRPEFASLASMRANALSELRHAACPDVLLAALAEALSVDVYWLMGLSDVRERPAHVPHLLKDS